MSDNQSKVSEGGSIQTATLGGGCFWCLEPVFEELKGVLKATVGYAGGRVPNPGYQQVCSGMTGHAEVVQIQFDSHQITFEDLLWVFFSRRIFTPRERENMSLRKLKLFHKFISFLK